MEQTYRIDEGTGFQDNRARASSAQGKAANPRPKHPVCATICVEYGPLTELEEDLSDMAYKSHYISFPARRTW